MTHCLVVLLIILGICALTQQRNSSCFEIGCKFSYSHGTIQHCCLLPRKQPSDDGRCLDCCQLNGKWLDSDTNTPINENTTKIRVTNITSPKADCTMWKERTEPIPIDCVETVSFNYTSVAVRILHETSNFSCTETNYGAIQNGGEKYSKEQAIDFITKALENGSSNLLTNIDNILENINHSSVSSSRTNSIELNVISRSRNSLLSEKNLSAFSQTSVRSVITTDKTIQDVSIVLAQIQLPENYQQQAILSKQNFETTITQSPLVNSPVLSINVFNKSATKPIQANVSFSIKIQNDKTIKERFLPFLTDPSRGKDRRIIQEISYTCQYYDENERQYSGAGCKVQYRTETDVICNCNHTTIFAVLLSVRHYPIPYYVTILSYITESISLVCLALTWGILMKLRKKIRNDRTVVQLNLTTALFAFHLCNLLHDLALKNERLCEGLAVFNHYFILASAMWMLMEGFLLLIKTTNSMLNFRSEKRAKIVKIMIGFGWGIPGVIVLFATVIGFATHTYMDQLNNELDYQRCWLSRNTGVLLGAVIIPIGIICLINLVIAINAIAFVYKMSMNAMDTLPISLKENDNNAFNLTSIKAASKAVPLLFFVLGIPWAFGFLSNLSMYESSVAFMIVNVLLNGLQGLFLLIIYCVVGSEVRQALALKVKQTLSPFVSLEKSVKNTPNENTTLRIPPKHQDQQRVSHIGAERSNINQPVCK